VHKITAKRKKRKKIKPEKLEQYRHKQKESTQK